MVWGTGVKKPSRGGGGQGCGIVSFRGTVFLCCGLFVWIPKSVAVGGAVTDGVALLIIQLVFTDVMGFGRTLGGESGGRSLGFTVAH